MIVPIVSKFFVRLFGSRNERLVKVYHRRVEQINALEDQVVGLTDPQLREKTAEFRKQITEGAKPAEVRPMALAVAREVMDRAVGMRNILNPEHAFDPSQLPSDMRSLYQKLREQADAMAPIEVRGHQGPVPGWMQIDIPVALYDAVRKLYPTSRPPFRTRPFDVQLIGGMVLSEGKIAEMKTGEGKTIVAPLACYLACIENLKSYVVTVNDYLVQRDRDWVFPFYHHLGLHVGAIHPYHMQPQPVKQQAYDCDVVYGTNSEFGFDFLRDNMKLATAEQVQTHRDFCIIDEVDSILIDEARTPLIISGPAHDDAPRYGLADSVARHLCQVNKSWQDMDNQVQKAQMHIKGLEGDIRNSRDKDKIAKYRQQIKELEAKVPELEAQRDQYTQYFEVEMEKKAAYLTHEGVAEAQKNAGIGSFYVGNNMDFPHLLENALRAHVVYQRDKEYVVQNGEVVIVDEFTGRLMVGRQWSDGLHQAVEAKEGVKIKQETQTLATVTIQNFFKLFKRLAGMTGTAVTEATEFDEIYRLDVVSIPTNVPVIRDDRNDLIYLSQKDKWNAILDEIKQHHDLGRPVLVGTTSVEASEFLSQLLTKRMNIKHEVLNAKQHEREAHIVEHAGELGAVMIATNMAGRGTDIKLRPIAREALVHHWKQRNLLPRQADASQSDEQLLNLLHRHLAQQLLEIKPKELETLGDEEVCLKLLQHWVSQEAWIDPSKAALMEAQSCINRLDKVRGFAMHRIEVWDNIEKMGGLHIVGTERHEARRIDNQLRGRAGRQGDRGSSRFFISLEDDLMKMFAGPRVLSILSKLGMKEGDAIEHPMVTRSVERAQRKVEERNYQMRKNLLEYDEVMEVQRTDFYHIRQEVLEGKQIETLVLSYMDDAIEDAVQNYLDQDYVATQAAEWCRVNLDVSIEAAKLRMEDLGDLQKQVRAAARAEVQQTVEVTIGEYMSDDLLPDEWDTKGLSAWAQSRFHVDLKQNQIRKMNPPQVQQVLVEAANEQVDGKDLSGLAKYLEPLYGEKELADWVNQKFNFEIEPAKLEITTGEPRAKGQDRVAELIYQQALERYRRREIEYPIEFALDMTVQTAEHDRQQAAAQLAAWVNQRYVLGWDPQGLLDREPRELYKQMVQAAEQWHSQKMGELVDKAIAEHRGDAAKLSQWCGQRLRQDVPTEELEKLDEAALRERLEQAGKRLLRTELTQLERFVLLQILDSAWKDHLYEMDQLKESVGLRGYAERDPRIEYKREGAEQFRQMQQSVRDRVTELIFRARLTANVQMKSVYDEQQAMHEDATSAMAAGAGAGTAQQQADLEAAERAGGEDSQRFMSRKQRRAAAATGAREESSPDTAPRGGGFKQRKRRKR